MKKNYDYSETVLLKHNELAATVNQDTGEVKVKKTRTPRLPEGKIHFEPEATFSKNYSKSWEYLDKNLTPIEYKAAHRLAMMAKAFTNSLEPLNDDTTIPELMEVLNVSKNIVKKITKKLFDLGVYGKFEVAEKDKPYTKYWILNPYLAFNGKLINSDIANLFKNTLIAKAFRGDIT